MSNKIYYCRVPEWGTVFKVQENCCYEMVVYEGGQIGITSRFDKDNSKMNGRLLCRCDPKIEILEISESEYGAFYEKVNGWQRSNLCWN